MKVYDTAGVKVKDKRKIHSEEEAKEVLKILKESRERYV